jgi:RNA polymerase sigma-70 factor (ECF subfamily)
LKTGEPSQDNKTVDPASLNHWIEEAKKGDLEAFQEIYAVYASRILNFIYRMLHSVDEAEDLTQETFVAVYRKLSSLQDTAKFEHWLFRIARNFVYQKYRGRAPATVSLDALDEEGQLISQVQDTRKNPAESFQTAELEQVVDRVIRNLPEKYREVFVLSALGRLSYQSIAEILGRSLASVKTDIHRARLEVRKQVKDYLKV